MIVPKIHLYWEGHVQFNIPSTMLSKIMLIGYQMEEPCQEVCRPIWYSYNHIDYMLWIWRSIWYENTYLDRPNSNFETDIGRIPQTLEGFNELEIDFHPAFLFFPFFIIILMCCICCTISKIIRNTARNFIPGNGIPPAGTMPNSSSCNGAGLAAESVFKQIFLRIICEIICRKIFSAGSNCGNKNLNNKFKFEAKPGGGAVPAGESIRLATGFGGTSRR